MGNSEFSIFERHSLSSDVWYTYHWQQLYNIWKTGLIKDYTFKDCLLFVFISAATQYVFHEKLYAQRQLSQWMSNYWVFKGNIYSKNMLSVPSCLTVPSYPNLLPLIQRWMFVRTCFNQCPNRSLCFRNLIPSVYSINISINTLQMSFSQL